MNTQEKLEQSGIVKEKGTQYFKVCTFFVQNILKVNLLCFYASNMLIILIFFFLFKEGKYKQASVQYKKIVSWLEHESTLSEEDEMKAKALRLAAHLNLAMCYLKLKEPNLALENCDKVL